MGADAPLLRSRQRGHRICRHPWCGPDSERPVRGRRDETVRREIEAQQADGEQEYVEHVLEEGQAEAQ